MFQHLEDIFFDETLSITPFCNVKWDVSGVKLRNIELRNIWLFHSSLGCFGFCFLIVRFYSLDGDWWQGCLGYLFIYLLIPPPPVLRCIYKVQIALVHE